MPLGLHVGGVLSLFAGDFVSVWVHSDADSSYAISSSSGFSAIMLASSLVGAGADLGDKAAGSGALVTQDWQEVGGWRATNGLNGLFPMLVFSLQGRQTRF